MTQHETPEQRLERERAEEARVAFENLTGLAHLVAAPDFQRFFLDGYLQGQESEALEKMKTAAPAELVRLRDCWLHVQHLRNDLRDIPHKLARATADTKEVAGASE